MNSNFYGIASLLGVALLLSSCTTTGDPRSGGIFWSPSKAQARQNELLGIQAQAQREADAAESRTGDLRRQISSLKSQIAAKKRSLNSTSSIEEASRIRAEIRKLEKDLDNLYSL
jgi:TolA-binding protein